MALPWVHGRLLATVLVAAAAVSVAGCASNTATVPGGQGTSADASESFVPHQVRVDYVNQAVDYYYYGDDSQDDDELVSLFCNYYKYGGMVEGRTQVTKFSLDAAQRMAAEYGLSGEEEGLFVSRLTQMIGVGCGQEIPAADMLPETPQSQTMLARGENMASQAGGNLLALCKDLRRSGTADFLKTIKQAAVDAGEPAPSQTDAQWVLVGLNCPEP